MKFPEQAGLVLASLALALVGCDSSPSRDSIGQAEPEPEKARTPGKPIEISSPVPPVEPSPVPQLPSTPWGDPEPKKDEPKKDEMPKAEPPK